MATLGGQVNQFLGKTRFVVCRVFLQLSGAEIIPLLGLLNRVTRKAIESQGDLQTLGEGLVEVCQNLLQYGLYWQAAANEGDVIWDANEAADYVDELFTDSAQRYLANPSLIAAAEETLTVPISENLVVMLVVASEGEVPALETDLADLEAMEEGLKAMINLHYQQRLRAIQIHFSPARLGDELTDDQLLQNFPELIPL
ncbi:MAG: DUF1517 domain-containing protein [Microcoleaceae cyanobacterium]